MRAARTDANQSEIIHGLRVIGATVQPLHTVGRGCPDILVGWRGKNFLIEIKDGRKPESARTLTADQVNWHGTWAGQVTVAASLDDALRAVGAMP